MDLKEKKLTSKEIYKGKIIDVYCDQVLCPNGNISTREVVRHCKASCILAFLPNGKVLLEKQYRYPYDEILYELPAGKVDEKEDCKEAALRELGEETGYKAHQIHYLGCMYPTCAYTDEELHLYVATDLIKTKQNLDENESVEVLEVSFKELLDLIQTNQLKDAKSICAVQLYLLKNHKIIL